MSGDNSEDPCATNEVRLDKEAEEKLVQRLYYRQLEINQQREEERMNTLRRTSALSSSKKLTKAEEEQLVSRMYDQQLQQLAATKEEHERKEAEEVHKKDVKLESSEIEDQVKRMYDEELAKNRQHRQELDQRFHPKRESKKMSQTELQEAVARLYHVDYAKKDEELFKKYVYPYDPKAVKMSRADEGAMADRLSTKGSS